MLFVGPAVGLSLYKATGCDVRKCRFGPPKAMADASMASLQPTQAGPEAASELLRDQLRDALGGQATTESLRTAILSSNAEMLALAGALRPLVGAALAPRVAGLAHGTLPSAQPYAAKPLGDFEVRALELMGAGQWIDAHDVRPKRNPCYAR